MPNRTAMIRLRLNIPGATGGGRAESSSSVSELSQPDSKSDSTGGSTMSGRSSSSGWFRVVRDDAAAFWDATFETNEELALGGWGSGVKVENRVFHSSGLTLRLRSPRPLMSSLTWRRAPVGARAVIGSLAPHIRFNADIAEGRFTGDSGRSR